MSNEHAQEMWAETCFLLSEDLPPNVSESIFEERVLLVLEKLGWSRFKKQIEIHPSLQIGRQGAIEPDIIMLDDQGQRQIVVEVKRPAEPIDETRNTLQLTSYMRQTKAQYGLLIGSEVRIYYDGPENPEPDPLLLESIQFLRDSREGVDFVSFLERAQFFAGKREEYAKKRIDAHDELRKRQELKRTLVSDSTKRRIYDFLKNEFSAYGEVVIERVLSEIEIHLSPKEQATPPSPTKNQVSKIAGSQRRSRTAVVSDSQLSGRTLSLSELNNERLNKNTKPKFLIIEDIKYPVKNWTELSIEFVKWLLQKGYLTSEKIPILSYSGRNKYFINNEERHLAVDADAQWNKVETVYVDTKYNAEGHKRNIISTLKQLGANISYSEIKIEFR